MRPKTACEAVSLLLSLFDRSTNNPPAYAALFSWRQGTYFGYTQPIYSDQPEIVLVSKTSRTLYVGFVTEIRRQRQDIPTLEVPEVIDFTGNYHILRKQGNNLVPLTPEQVLYAQTNPITLRDQTQVPIVGPETHLYQTFHHETH